MEFFQWVAANWQAVCGWITGLFVLGKLLRGFTSLISSAISVVRRSHSIWSNGLVFGSLKVRWILKVFFAEGVSLLAARVAVAVGVRRRP